MTAYSGQSLSPHHWNGMHLPRYCYYREGPTLTSHTDTRETHVSARWLVATIAMLPPAPPPPFPSAPARPPAHHAPCLSPAACPFCPSRTFSEVRGQAAHKDLLATRLLAHPLRNRGLRINLQRARAVQLKSNQSCPKYRSRRNACALLPSAHQCSARLYTLLPLILAP